MAQGRKVKIPVVGTVNKTVFIDPLATRGATLGMDLFTPDGIVGTPNTVREWLGLTALPPPGVEEDPVGIQQHHRLLQGLTLGDDHPQYTQWVQNEDITGQWDFQNITRFANGAAATPSITFIADDNTGLYSAGADIFGFATAGAERLRIDAGGGVGFGGANFGTAGQLLLSAGPGASPTWVTRTLTAGAGLTGGGTLAADRTFAVGAGTGITVNADDVAISVDGVTNTLLANMAEATIKGRAAAAGTGDPTDLSAAQVVTIINSSLDHGALIGLADDDHTQYVLRSILTTDGDLFYRSGGAVARLGIGSAGQVLSVVSGAPAWAAGGGGGGTVDSVVGTANQINVDSTDPANPVVSLASSVLTSLGLADTSVQPARQIISGAGLTGGGDLSADRTLAVGAGTGITVNADDVALSSATIASLALADTSVQPARTLTAGAGLTGGGDLSANRTFDVGAGTGITVNANDVAISTDGVTNTLLANMAEATIKGRAAAAGTGDPTDLTAAQVATIVNASLDHGTLTGLADDDHTQYVLRSILTTDGDLFYRSGGAVARLGVGTNNQVLTVVSGAPAWATGGGGATGANPTASVGLTAVNGVATTFLRSDGAPPLDQGIAPTWTGSHIFSNALAFEIAAAQPAFQMSESDQGTDAKNWRFRVNSSIIRLETRTDANGAGTEIFAATRSGTAVTDIQLGNTTDNPTVTMSVDGTQRNVGWRELPQNIQNGNYTLILSDNAKQIYKASGGAGETFTIPANSSVAYPIGTMFTFVNDGGGTLTIAITTDTLELSPGGTTGSRTLADNGVATALKVTSTVWKIWGTGLT